MRRWWIFTFLLAVSTASSWCEHGTIIRDGLECLCTLEGENSCTGGPGCISGYGSSFYPRTCASCKCKDPRSASKKERVVQEVEGDVEEVDKYLNWREQLAKAKTYDSEKRKNFIVVVSSVSIFLVLSTVVCCIMGTSFYFCFREIKYMHSGSFIGQILKLVRWVVSFLDICATLPSLLDIQR